MTWLAVRAINNPEASKVGKNNFSNSIFLNILKDELLASLSEFKSDFPSVRCLVASQTEALPDRDWNWRNPDFRYAPSRAKSQPGYVGSYW
jgi:hypothetical protein